MVYIQTQKAVVGVIYNPFSDELFKAWLGGGAWLNGKRLSVANNKVRFD